ASCDRSSIPPAFAGSLGAAVLLVLDLHAQHTTRLERESRQLRGLLDRPDQGAPGADDDLGDADDSRALALDELTVDRDFACAADLAAGEHSGLAHDELRAVP